MQCFHINGSHCMFSMTIPISVFQKAFVFHDSEVLLKLRRWLGHWRRRRFDWFCSIKNHAHWHATQITDFFPLQMNVASLRTLRQMCRMATQIHSSDFQTQITQREVTMGFFATFGIRFSYSFGLNTNV